MKSLTHIVRGAVRIEKNPKLCFVDTIDWSIIARNTDTKDHIIYGNQAQNECPVCPSGKKNEGTTDGDQTKILDCPVALTDPKQRLCWNRDHCQKGMCFSNTLHETYNLPLF